MAVEQVREQSILTNSGHHSSSHMASSALDPEVLEALQSSAWLVREVVLGFAIEA